MSVSSDKTSSLHEKLIELLRKLRGLGKISDVIFQTLQGVLSSKEKIITCYYQLNLSETPPVEGEEQTANFYSCEIYLITTSNFITLGFYPNYHNYKIKSIYQINEIKFQRSFSTAYEKEETVSAEERNYQPVQVSLEVYFGDEKGNIIDEWKVDTTKEESIDLIQSQIRLLNRCVGMKLSDIQI